MLNDCVRLKYILTAVLMLCASSRCGGMGYDSGDVPSYRSAIRPGRKIIAPALEREKQFTKTEHMLIMYGGTGSAQHEWQTVSYLGGRCELTMFVDVMLSDDGKTVETVSREPTFDLNVCSKISDSGACSYQGSRHQKFGLDKWNQFRDSGFDLKIMDPHYDGSVLKNFEPFADTVQQSRKIWR